MIHSSVHHISKQLVTMTRQNPSWASWHTDPVTFDPPAGSRVRSKWSWPPPGGPTQPSSRPQASPWPRVWLVFIGSARGNMTSRRRVTAPRCVCVCGPSGGINGRWAASKWTADVSCARRQGLNTHRRTHTDTHTQTHTQTHRLDITNPT